MRPRERGDPPMSHVLVFALFMLVANVAAALATIETGDSRWTVYIGAVSAIVIALSSAIIVAAPHVARAATAIATTIMPALAMIWKQNEEINKGTYTDQIQKLTAKTEEQTKLLLKAADDRAKIAADLSKSQEAAAANQKEAAEKIAALTDELAQARDEIRRLTEKEHRAVTAMAIKQDQQDAASSATKAEVSEIKAAIQRIDAERSGPMPMIDGGSI
jgi:glutamine synthetase type III